MTGGISIERRAVLVTGANRGLGEAFVRTFLSAGAARIYAAARHPDSARHLADAAPNRVVPIRLDVTDEAQAFEAARVCSDVSILVNNAGVFRREPLLSAPSLDAAREEMDVNYFGLVATTRAFAPVLAANGGGAVVNVLSAAAICASPAMGGYAASKFAARAATLCLRAELAAQDTFVTALIVGAVDTRLSEGIGGAKATPADIAAAGLKALAHRIEEMDTDAQAIALRAALARDPKGLERSLARVIRSSALTTGR